MTSTRTRITRLLLAVAVVVPSLVLATAPSFAAPTEEEVDAAQAKVDALGHELETQIEEYNDARYRLEQIRERLHEAKVQMDTAEEEAAAARQQLSDRAVEAYIGTGNQLDVLLEAQDFSEFSDRLTFMGAIAQSDADLAATADAAGQKAEWAADEYARAASEAKDKVAEMAALRETIEGMLAEQEAIYRELNIEYQDYLAEQRAQAAAAAAAEQAAANDDGSSAPNEPPLPPPPPANASAAGIAVNAALSVQGAEYVWGSAGPSTFDCSGLTSWAWAQAGVYLPHSASAQYSSLPRVPLSDVQVGDIIYYGNFGPHVALYIGGGQIVHARHPGPGGQVQRDGMYSYDQPWGAVRPG
jgi:cell wall-associated NlpC family hydrolase